MSIVVVDVRDVLGQHLARSVLTLDAALEMARLGGGVLRGVTQDPSIQLVD